MFRSTTALLRPLDRPSETALARLRCASSDGKAFPLRGQPSGEAAALLHPPAWLPSLEP
ncbi:MAG: hypothetical protein J2P37_05185 [Ktedonobacteraceae bacterium]|nr:hypothetical protein [Ktedonobacteraceae bacterium]